MGVEFVCDRAVKGKDWIRLYDGGDLVLEHGGITDFGGISVIREIGSPAASWR